MATDRALTYEYWRRFSGHVVVDVGGPEGEQRGPSDTDHGLREDQYHHVRTIAEAAAQVAYLSGVHLLCPLRPQSAHIIAQRRVAAESAGDSVRLRQQVGQHEHHGADALHARAEADPRRNAPTSAEVADEDGGAEGAELDRGDDEPRRRAADLEALLDRRDDAADVAGDEGAGDDGEDAAEEGEALDVEAALQVRAVHGDGVVGRLRDVTV